MSRDGHIESTHAAIEAVGEVGKLMTVLQEKRRELAELVAQAQNERDNVLGLVIQAVGENPATHSGRNFSEFTVATFGNIDELSALVEQVNHRIEEVCRGLDNAAIEGQNYIGGL